MQTRLLAYLSGPQEWTYSINPDHMNVQLPRNIEDVDIEHADVVQPLSTPTAMYVIRAQPNMVFETIY